MDQKPSVGRIVHYYPHVDDSIVGPVAAIVTAVDPMPWRADASDVISATVFWPLAGPAQNPYIPYSETPEPGHWSWPPRT